MKKNHHYLKFLIRECLNEILFEQDSTNPVAEDPKVQSALKNKAVADRRVADAEISALNSKISDLSQQEREAAPENKDSIRQQIKHLKDQMSAAKLRKTTANKTQTASK